MKFVISKGFVLLLLLLPALSHAEVVITEIMYDLPEPGTDEGHEWIEVFYNDPDRDFSNYYRFFENNTNHTLTYIRGGIYNNSNVTTGEYIVIADDAAQFLLDYPNFSGKLFDSSWDSLSNVGEALSIKGGGITVDEVTYSSSQGASGDGNSLQKQSDGGWIAAIPTPGLTNSTSSAPSTPIVNVSGTIIEDSVWSPVNGDYILNGMVTVSASSTLTIEPGTTIKNLSGSSYLLVVEGNLIAEGTPEAKIRFDSVSIEITTRAGSVRVTNATLNGAGGLYGIFQEGGTLEIGDSTLRGFRNGLYLFGSTTSAIVTSNVFESNTEYGVYAYEDVGSITLTNSNFVGNNKTAYIPAAVSFVHSGNVSTDTSKGFETIGFARDGAVWHSSDLPIRIVGGVRVEAGKTLNVSPGTEIKMTPSSYLQIEGNLSAVGTESQKIQFVSSLSNPTNGSWKSLIFQAGSSGSLSHVVIKHAGEMTMTTSELGFVRAGLINVGGSVSLSSVAFVDNIDSHIYQGSGSLTVINADFDSLNAGYNQGLILTGGSATITKSKFNANSTGVGNRSASTTVDARNNWWGSSVGPTYIYGSVLYDPWIRRDPALPNPVIIVPGIMGSELYKSDSSVATNLIWPDPIKIGLNPSDDFLDILELDEFGLVKNNFIVKGDLVRKINQSDYFEGLIAWLENNYDENSDLFVFPYDWRLYIEDSTSRLRERIDEIKLQTGAEKVNIIAHSMGGLLVKAYLKDYEGNSISKFIDIGTPHTGASSAFKTLMYGDNLGIRYIFGLFNLNQSRIKKITQNMPSVYQLLPSRSYFENSGRNYYVTDMTNGTNRYDYNQTKDYLKTQGRNSLLVDRADEFHQEIDNFDPTALGVATYNIVGCGVPTLGHFYILDKKGDQYSYNIGMIDGDGTVPLSSAKAMQANETYYVKGVQHAVMPSSSGIKELVAAILAGESFEMAAYSNIATNSDGCGMPNGRIVSFHSPIDLHIYDSSNNHVGPDESGDIENNILGVVYEVIDGDKFAFLPDGQEYQISGNSTGIGTFDVRIEAVVDDEVVQTTIFNDIPLSEATRTNFDIGADIPSKIYLDSDGDGNFESSQSFSTTTAGFLESSGKIPEVSVPSPTLTETSTLSIGSSKPSSISQTNQVILAVAPQVLGAASKALPRLASRAVEQKSVVPTSAPPEKLVKEEIRKTFGGKLKQVVKNIWVWFKSKI